MKVPATISNQGRQPVEPAMPERPEISVDQAGIQFMLPDMETAALGGTGRHGLSGIWSRMPPPVLRALLRLAEQDPEVSLVFDLESATEPAALPTGAAISFGAATDPAKTRLSQGTPPDPHTPYAAENIRTAAQLKVLSYLLRRVDEGSVTVAELNQFVALASIGPDVVRRSMAELKLDPAGFLLHGICYLFSGRQIVPAKRQPEIFLWTREHWYAVAAAALVIGLAAAALFHHS